MGQDGGLLHGPWSMAAGGGTLQPIVSPRHGGRPCGGARARSLQRVRLRREKFSTGGYLGVRTSAVSSLSSAPEGVFLDTTQVRSIEDRYSPQSS